MATVAHTELYEVDGITYPRNENYLICDGCEYGEERLWSYSGGVWCEDCLVDKLREGGVISVGLDGKRFCGECSDLTVVYLYGNRYLCRRCLMTELFCDDVIGMVD